MKNYKLILVFVLLVVALLGCASPSDIFSDDNYVKIQNEINQIITNQNIGDLQIIDVRTPDEFTAGCLPLAKNIDVESADFLSQISLLDKNGYYLVYCRSGKRSAEAVTQMREDGFNNIIELDGGITNWADEGYDVSQDCMLK